MSSNKHNVYLIVLKYVHSLSFMSMNFKVWHMLGISSLLFFLKAGISSSLSVAHLWHHKREQFIRACIYIPMFTYAHVILLAVESSIKITAIIKNEHLWKNKHIKILMKNMWYKHNSHIRNCFRYYILCYNGLLPWLIPLDH